MKNIGILSIYFSRSRLLAVYLNRDIE